jgi:hypothetical protein
MLNQPVEEIGRHGTGENGNRRLDMNHTLSTVSSMSQVVHVVLVWEMFVRQEIGD